MCISFFSTTSDKIVLFLALVNLSEWPSSRTQIHVLVFMQSVWCSSPHLMKAEMCQYMLAKFPKTTFNKNVFGIAQLVTCRQTHTMAKKTGTHLQQHSEHTTAWCNFPQKVDNYTQRQETPWFYRMWIFKIMHVQCGRWHITSMQPKLSKTMNEFLLLNLINTVFHYIILQ